MLSLWSEARTANLPIEMSADRHEIVTLDQSVGVPLGLVPMSDEEKKVSSASFFFLHFFFYITVSFQLSFQFAKRRAVFLELFDSLVKVGPRLRRADAAMLQLFSGPLNSERRAVPHRAEALSRHTPGSASHDASSTPRSAKRIPAMNIGSMGSGTGFQGGVLGGVAVGGASRRQKDSETANGEVLFFVFSSGLGLIVKLD
jgi:hypothetical protein